MLLRAIGGSLTIFFCLKPVKGYPLKLCQYNKELAILVFMILFFIPNPSYFIVLVVLLFSICCLYDGYYYVMPMRPFYILILQLGSLALMQVGGYIFFYRCIISVFLYLIFFGINRCFMIKTKKDALGSGDIDFICAYICIMGLKETLFMLLFGSMVGIGVGCLWKQERLPFIPCLMIGSLIYLWI